MAVVKRTTLQYLHCRWCLRYAVISVSAVYSYIYLMSVLRYAGNESVRKRTAFEALRKDSIR